MLAALIAGGLIGALLGLMGGGGSIFAVPVLIYILGLNTKAAIGTSLLVVGAASLLAAWSHYRSQNVDFPVAALFGVSGAIGSFAGARVAQLIPDALQVYMFSALMLLVALLILTTSTPKETYGKTSKAISLLGLGAGLAAGILTGILGVGGGFVIVPALVLLMRLPLIKAIGTSLLIIGINSLVGALSYLPGLEFGYGVAVFAFSVLSFAVIAGRYARFVPQQKLKVTFAISLILMSVFMLARQSLI